MKRFLLASVLASCTAGVTSAEDKGDDTGLMQAQVRHHASQNKSQGGACKQCSDRGGCNCECSWAKGGGSCGGDDGSCCYACCCWAPPAPAPCTDGDDGEGSDVQPSPPAPAPPMELYCPTGRADIGMTKGPDPTAIADDGEEVPGITIDGNGWTITGANGAHVKASFNLLGGYIEFDMDLSKVHPEVNTNLYTISPEKGIAGSGYCDIQDSPNYPNCLEWDIDENNGKCAMQTTLHTWANHNGGCDQGGCYSNTHLNSDKVHIKASMSVDGWPTIEVNGRVVEPYSPAIAATSAAYVVEQMRTVGAAVWSSQWVGWVPLGNECPRGSADLLATSIFSVSNLKIHGSVVQGAAPTLCK